MALRALTEARVIATSNQERQILSRRSLRVNPSTESVQSKNALICCRSERRQGRGHLEYGKANSSIHGIIENSINDPSLVAVARIM